MNKNIVKKIDRVKNIYEAKELQELGADILCLSLDKKDSFQDTRFVTIQEALLIREVVTKAKLAVEIITEDEISLTQSIHFDCFQISEGANISKRTAENLKKDGKEIIYAGIQASYEDDPSWIVGTIEDDSKIESPAFYQLELFADVENSWEFLNNETAKYSEELQIEDIEKIAQEFPILITLDFSPNNILEIINKIPSARGINLSLGNPSNNNTHCFEYDTIINILNAIEQL